MNKHQKETFIKFGQNIKRFRQERKMTLEDLAQKTGIRVQYLEKIESGKAYGMNSSYIFIFADAFVLDPYKIVKWN